MGGEGTCTLSVSKTTDAPQARVHSAGATMRRLTAGGIITSSPAGIDCGSICSFDFPPGTTVMLTATPNVGSAFSGWGGVCSGMSRTCSVAMSVDQTVSASFGLDGSAQQCPR